MKKLVVLCITLSLAGCSKDPAKPNPVQEVGCNLAKTVTLVLSSQMAEALACKQPLAIKADLDEVLVKMNVCLLESASVGMSVSSSIGSVGSTVCKMVSNTLFEALTTEKFAKWQCEGGMVKEKLLSKAAELCDKIK